MRIVIGMYSKFNDGWRERNDGRGDRETDREIKNESS